jgi:hypothetical protein
MENSFPAEPNHAAPSEPHPVTEPPISQAQEPGAPESGPAALPEPASEQETPRAHRNDVPSAQASSEETAAATPPQEHAHSDPGPQDHQETASAEAEESARESAEHEAEAPGHSAHASEHDAAGAVHESGSLEDFAARSSRGRLNNEEESEAAAALKEALLGGRADVAKAVAATPSLPWIVSVQATAAAWPDMKPSFRSQFLAGLARAQGEQAARIRLSLARGLFKVDQGAALKLILLTLKLLRNKATGLLEGKGPALFANVLIGRGKAWALQLPLQSLKPVEADLLVFAALHGAFYAPQAPIAQLSILKWAASAERLTRLPEALEALILKGIARWSAKWQGALRKEVSPLPESWTESLKDQSPKRSGSSEGPKCAVGNSR